MRPYSDVLVIATRRIGDVLLATPLIRSVRRAWPAARIDVLVFSGTGGVLKGNTDVASVIEVAERIPIARHVAFLARLWRRYDLALSLAPGDRPSIYAWAAGRRRIGLLSPGDKHRWKHALMSAWAPFDNVNTHTVLMHLALADLLGIERAREVVVSWRQEDIASVDRLLEGAGEPLAVFHPWPKFNYKMWRREGWIEIAQWLSARGFRVVLSGGPDPEECGYLDELSRALPGGTLNLAGKLTLGGVGFLLSRASLYVGPDTVVTHMAAALGVPTVALYGPTDPVKWGPWPKDYAVVGNPWRRLGSQSAGRVRLVQGNAACAPCNKEGCDRHVGSFSDCLQQLPAERVIAAIESVIQ